jgi:hypothetical protein
VRMRAAVFVEALLLVSTPESAAAHLGLHQRVLQLAVHRDRQVGRHRPRRGGPDGDCRAVHVLLQAVWDALSCGDESVLLQAGCNAMTCADWTSRVD